MSKKRLVIGITASGSVNLLRGQLNYFGKLGYETYLLAPDDERTRAFCAQEGCQLLPVKIAREISIFSDLLSLLTIIKHFYSIKPDVVNVGTPKMGLLGMIAGWLLGIKRRIYTCRGFRYEHEKGIKKGILITMERIAGYCAQNIICISPSVMGLGVNDKIFKREKCKVIHQGSSNGISIKKFNAEKVVSSDNAALKQKLDIVGRFVFGFVGRLNDRKGITELYEAFANIFEEDNNSRLLIVGPAEFEQISDRSIIQKLKTHPGILMPGRTDNVPLYLSVMDVFALPTWAEGFGNVLVEAAAMGIPVISTKGTGARDAVCDGYNGILVDVKNAEQLAAAMTELKENNQKRLEMGRNGVEWAQNFDSQRIWDGMHELYITAK